MAGEHVAIDAIAAPFDAPADWTTPQLSTHCEFVRDGDWIESKDQGGNDYRLLQISNIGVGRFIETGNFRCTTEDTFKRLNCTEILAGDVLVARMPDPTGRAWYANELPWRAVTAVDVAIVRTKPNELDPRFLSYFLNSPQCLALVHGLTTGTTRLRIRRADIERLCIPLPPVPEQRAIAHILGTLDDKIELNRRMNETLEKMARALFKSWFVDFDPVRAKVGPPSTSGRGAGGEGPRLPKHIADLFPDSFEDSELGPVPEGWQECKLREVLFEKKERVGELEVQVYSSTNDGLQPRSARFKKQLSKTDEKNKLIHEGDMVFGLSRRILNFGLMQENIGSVSAAYKVFSVDKEKIPPDFLYQMMRIKADYFYHAISASSREGQSISVEGLERLVFTKPSKKVLDHYYSKTSPLFAQITSLNKESATLAAIRDTLLPKLISGELRIKDPDAFLETIASPGATEYSTSA